MCSFENLRKADETLKEDFPCNRSPDGESSIYRKGVLLLNTVFKGVPWHTSIKKSYYGLDGILI